MTELLPDTGAEAGWRRAGLLGGVSALFGGSAVAAASCCVVPLTLAGVGASAAVSPWLEWLAPFHVYLAGVTVLALGAGWLLFLRQNRHACAADGTCLAPASRRRHAAILGVATAVAVLVLSRPYIEPVMVERILGGA